MKEKVSSLEDELSRNKKVLYLDYEECKNEIKNFLADFMVDDYVPGKKIIDEVDHS